MTACCRRSATSASATSATTARSGANRLPEFFVLKPANGQPATFANGGTISFVAPNRAAVAAFHKAALAAGGKDEGAVGPRNWQPHAYGAYVRDLDGNKLATYCLKPE